MAGYLEGLLKVGELIGKKSPKGVYSVTVVHDDNCPMPDGGECICKPEFEVKEI